MCQFSLDAKSFAGAHGINFPEYFAIEYQELKTLEDAGLVVLNNYDITVPIKGRLLARRVAMVFDRHLRQSKPFGIYSKVL